MDRRNWMVLFGTSAIGFEALAVAQAQDEKPITDEMHENCANACYECARKCIKGFKYCHGKVVAGMKLYEKAAAHCNDCSEVCFTAAKLVDRRSPLMKINCHACAKICEQCIAVCEKLNDPEMNATMESLRKCHRLCQDMAREMGHHHEK